MTAWHRDFGRRIVTITAFVVAIWIVALINGALFEGRLLAYGIHPRTEEGLYGILFSPLLHNGIDHLLANTVGLAVFGGLVVLRSVPHFWAVTLVGVLAGGGGTWLFGRPYVHVGASGLVFAYFGYLLVTGWFERRFGPLLLSIGVFVLWGPVLFGVLPQEHGISWEGHLFGLLGGILAAWMLAPSRPRHEL